MVWLVVWTAAIIVAVFILIGRLSAGDYAPVPILALWILVAGFALYRVGLRGFEDLTGERIASDRPRRNAPGHRWSDGIGEREER